MLERLKARPPVWFNGDVEDFAGGMLCDEPV